MAYPYKDNGAFFPGNEVKHVPGVITLSATAAGSTKIFNVPPGEHVVDLLIIGVAAVSATIYKAYAYVDKAQTLSTAKALGMLAINSETSVTLLTDATTSVTPKHLVRLVQGVCNATFQCDTSLNLPYGIVVTAVISSTTNTNGDATLKACMSPRI